MARRRSDDAVEQGLGDNPLADDDTDPLTDAFYGAPKAVPSPSPTPEATVAAKAPTPRRSRTKGRQPLQDGKSFRLVTFSFYEDDVERLDALLQQARRHGHRKASRSQIVRLALRQVDLTALPDDV